MKPRKIFEKIAYIAIGLSILVILGLIIFQHQLIKNMPQDIDSEASVDIAISKNEANKSVQKNEQDLGLNSLPVDNDSIPEKNELDGLAELLDETEKELDSVYRELSEQTERKAENAKNQREFYRRMTENPSFKAGIRESMKSTNEILYGLLFEDLDLSPDKLEKFKDLLADYQADIIVISQGTISVSSEEEGAELQKLYDNTEKEYKAKFKDLLGSEDYDVYQAYQDRLNERYVVNMFMESLGPDEKLTENQQQILVDSLYDEREYVYSETDYDLKKLEPFIFMNNDSIDRRMKATEEIHSRALENAMGSLSASQYEQLKNYLQQQREMEETSLKLAVQQFGEATTQEDTGKTTE